MFFVCEQDGIPERQFKRELSNRFLKMRKCIRAYLVQVKYNENDTNHVALYLKIYDNHDEDILKECANTFKSIFSNEYLNILFITKKSGTKNS